MHSKSVTRGFTLIELLITVTIIGIVASFAYPSYKNSVRTARRADAKAVLLQAAQWMERFATVNHRYDQTIDGTDVGTMFDASSLNYAPIEGTTKYYNISIDAVDQTTFTLLATPNPDTDQDQDACQVLTLENTGAKGVTDGSKAPTMAATDCWH